MKNPYVLVSRLVSRLSLPMWFVLGMFAQSVLQPLISSRARLVTSASWWVLLGFLLGQSLPSWSH